MSLILATGQSCFSRVNCSIREHGALLMVLHIIWNRDNVETLRRNFLRNIAQNFNTSTNAQVSPSECIAMKIENDWTALFEVDIRIPLAVWMERNLCCRDKPTRNSS